MMMTATMMAARSLNQALSRLSLSESGSAGRFVCYKSNRLISLRHRSDQPIAAVDLDAGGDVVELEMEPQPPPKVKPTSTAVALRQLDEAIQRIVARRSAPDWLPLVPGSSYWVPPPRRPPSEALFDLLSNFDNKLSAEEAMSLTTSRGWPSSAFYLHHHHHQGAPPDPVKLEITSKNTSDPEEEDK